MKNRAIILLAVATGLHTFSARAVDATGASGATPNQSAWKNESQVGVVLTSGNTRTTSVNAAQTSSYQFEKNIVKGAVNYLYQKNGDVVSGKSWTLGLRYERELSERFSIFLAETVEGNIFTGILQRYNTDLGSKYFIQKEEALTWFVEGGYRYSHENLVLVSRNVHYLRLYSEIEKKFNESVSGKYWVEFLPNLSVNSDWLLNSEISLSAALSSIFSVKSAYLVRYDNVVNAPGLTRTDTMLTTSLVAKF